MKILVTGATGFVGGNLVTALLGQGHKVFCLARLEKKAEHLLAAGGEIVVDDLLSPVFIGKYIEDCDVVFHVAGVIKGASREDYFHGNYLATKNLVRIIEQHGPSHQKLIYVSSQAASGPSIRSDFSESSPDALPVSTYGESKHAAEKEILSMSERRSVVILRPSIVYGPGDRALLSLFKAAQRGIIPRPGLRDMPVNFIFVQDLIRALLLAAEKPEAKNKIFFINDGMKYSWSIWNKALADCLNKNAISIPIAKAFLYASCQIGGIITQFTGISSFLNPDKWHEMKQTGWLCSNARIVKELGFFPCWSLTQGIKETAKWYIEAGWLSGKSNLLPPAGKPETPGAPTD
ncbi:MAG: NAD(P)-dependent oxidoreductase [Proteobacteria bacterium]|nr:NAD(P)-dependent oxidoreductase [Pseudomonadota bacterium]